MSIAILSDLQQEIRRLFIAGSGLSEGDLRLKKILPQLQKLGEAAPIFNRVAQSLAQVVEPQKGEQAAVRLLDLSILVNSILYTQGTTEPVGSGTDSVEIEGTNIALSTTISHRKLHPAVEALTSKGQGRMEQLRLSYEEECLQDFRIIPLAVAALDDGYAEVAEFVYEKVIPAYGNDALPTLRQQYNPQGGKSDGRRLRLLHRLLDASGMDLYLQAAQEGSVDVRSAAIELLGHYPEQESLILEQADDKKKEIRSAAFAGLAKLGTTKAVDRLYQALTSTKDRELALEPVSHCRAASLTSKIIANAEDNLQRIVSGPNTAGAKDATENKVRDEAIKQLLADVQALDEKQPEEVLVFLEKLLSTSAFMIPETEAIQQQAANQLLWMHTPEAYEFAISLQHEHSGRFIAHSFRAAYKALSPEEVYKRFAPELANPKKTTAKELLGAIHRVTPSLSKQLSALNWDTEGFSAGSSSEGESASKLDPRWIYVFAEIDEEELVWCLADRPDPKIAAYMVGKLQLKPSFRTHRTSSLLLSLFRIGYKEAPELLMGILEQETVKNLYYLDTGQRALLNLLPRSYADRLHQFAETLTYENIKNQIVEIAETVAIKPEESAANESNIEKGKGLWGWIKNKMS
ncbi:HEAT repeat-containing protein [Paenibacillus sp. 1_12]|uniref:HEAT repeat domain-containing protein n=1 Tax=Paenibacillus sp. 1_12 TaxID=1566278 RepID=UPI0008EC91DA|nr:HEAT repeat domain-containing protein [Paenibacillus sp. 1_12]SFL08442.1 HEAT repeat-containing protein [Paenibacillus sp. 1_12]